MIRSFLILLLWVVNARCEQPEPTCRELLQQADTYEREQNFAKTEELLIQATTVASEEEQDFTWQRLCRFYETQKILDAKISEWEKAGAVRPLIIAWYNVRHDTTNAIPWLVQSERPSDLEKLAHCYEQAQQWEKAAELYFLLGEKTDDNRKSYFLYSAAQAWLKAGAFDKTQELIEHLEKDFPGNGPLQKKVRELKSAALNHQP